MAPVKWRIGIVEDEKEYREAVIKALQTADLAKSLLSWGTAELFWNDESNHNLDLIYVDNNLPNMSGVELIGMLNERYPEMRIVMLTQVASDQTIFRALQSGAIGYLLKAELHDIATVTRQLMEGGAAITPTIALRVFQSFRKPAVAGAPDLTAREKQVLEIMVSGVSTEKAAEIMHISPGTIRVHIRNIYGKLNIKNKMELARKASEMGLL